MIIKKEENEKVWKKGACALWLYLAQQNNAEGNEFVWIFFKSLWLEVVLLE